MNNNTLKEYWLLYKTDTCFKSKIDLSQWNCVHNWRILLVPLLEFNTKEILNICKDMVKNEWLTHIEWKNFISVKIY